MFFIKKLSQAPFRITMGIQRTVKDSKLSFDFTQVVICLKSKNFIQIFFCDMV